MLTITQRESQIWAMYVQGFTRKEIAAKINRSFHTVNQITRTLYDKLGIQKETDLIREWFIYYSIITRDELKQAIIHKAAPMVITFLLITACQIILDTPALRIMRTGRTVTRTISRTQGRTRRKTYEL